MHSEQGFGEIDHFGHFAGLTPQTRNLNKDYSSEITFPAGSVPASLHAHLSS
jgi:hypothetical protein